MERKNILEVIPHFSGFAYSLVNSSSTCETPKNNGLHGG